MFVKPWVNCLRWAILSSPLIWLVLLNGCGSGTVLDPFTPTRIIAFGDAFMDVRMPRFTVNDEIPKNLPTQFSASNYYQYAYNNDFYVYGYLASTYEPGFYSSSTLTALNPELTVIERIAAVYGFTSGVIPMSTSATLSSSGVYSYAQGNALVNGQSYSVAQYPGSSSPALSVQAQIDLFLQHNSISSTDMFFVNAGTADVIYNTLGGGSASGVATAAQNLVNLVLTLKNAGAKHIVVFGPPNMGRSPFAYQNSLTTTLANYSKTLDSGSCIDFNCALEYKLQDAIGTITQNPVIFVDLSSQTSLITGTTNTGSANTYSSFTDPLYGIAISYPGDNSSTAFQDASAANKDGNYYCNNANVGSSYPFFITSTATPITQPYKNGIGLPITTGSYCFAKPSGPNDYRSYAYADSVYFTPSVNRMLGDLILGKLSLAGWR
jgi:hypothetical protein